MLNIAYTKQSTGEKACLEDLAAGKDCWPQFWRLFGRLIYYEFHKLGIDDAATREDLIQELAMKIVRCDHQLIRDHLDNPRQLSFAALLRVVSRNLGISYLRQRRRMPHIQLVDASLPLQPVFTPRWAADPASTTEMEQLLIALIDQACLGDRRGAGFQIMYLRFVDHESVSSIAERLKLKPNTVSKRIEYYLRRLRAAYGATLTGHSDE